MKFYFICIKNDIDMFHVKQISNIKLIFLIVSRETIYFPIQNLLNISPNKSSEVKEPVIEDKCIVEQLLILLRLISAEVIC